MNNLKKEMDMDFTKTQFPEGIHVCLIYDRDDDRQKIVSDYMMAGLKQGEQIRYLNDTTAAKTVRSWLLDMGVEVPEEDPALKVLSAESAYCPNGYFAPRELIPTLPPRYELARKAGYTGQRSCGEMTWVLKGIPGSDRLLEYEALLNTVVANFPHSGMCQYDARRFDGATLFKVLKLHPWMIVRGKIVQNPYYVSSEEFLKDFKSEQ
jgi:hypothetical protein